MVKKYWTLLGAAGISFSWSGVVEAAADALEERRASHFGGTWLDRFDALPPCVQASIENLCQQCNGPDLSAAQRFVESFLPMFQQLLPRYGRYELIGIWWEMIAKTIRRFPVIWENPATQALINGIDAAFQGVEEFVAIESGPSAFEREFPIHAIALRWAVNANDRAILKTASRDFLVARPLYVLPEGGLRDSLGMSAWLTQLVREARKSGLMDEELEDLFRAILKAYSLCEIMERE
ncbi:MAG: hypothetical protein LBJ81_01520 [Puniceicoccales bacterium]|jgi:hypothetical protein|nr:hypothetical protein [Puniceicoccales bacterium]